MTDTVVVEGQARFRDGKKWRSRWLVLRKPSPVADCLLLLVYKDKADKAKGHKERNSLTLEEICGLEPGLSYEGVSYTLAILCLARTLMLGFDSKETLLAWDMRIRYILGEVHRFNVMIQPGTKLECGPATLHLCNNLLVLARDLPPAVVGQWKLSDLRRYGAVPSGFVFEGGTRCGYWAGVFFLSCTEGEQISFLFDCIVRGISPTRGPFGVRPVLPDPSGNSTSTEERVKQEAQELEKRLSLLSHCSRQSSTASTSSYSASGASDERSISSSSSEASHSDSLGSRLQMWAEPVKSPAPTDPVAPPAGPSQARVEDNLSGVRGPPKLPRPRGLQEIGRQSSSDSGIATGSHSSSSYSGSFSSYTGSLDITQGEEFGSLLSLPEQNLCICIPADYQVPKQRYDTPRSLLQAPPPLADPTPQKHTHTLDSRAGDAAPPAGGLSDPRENYTPQTGVSRPLFAACPVCGRLKCNHSFNLNYITHEQWCSSQKKHCTQGTMPLHAGGLLLPTTPDKSQKSKEERGKEGVAYETLEGRGTAEADEYTSYELMRHYGHQRTRSDAGEGVSGSSATLKTHRLSSVADSKGGYELMASAVDVPKRAELSVGEYGAIFAFPSDLPPPPPRGDGVTYVNIPVSPTSKKQLHYMELELQEQGPGVRGGGSTKYAQIDITATETAHKVGTQHAQCREERLQELEQKRKGFHQ